MTVAAPRPGASSIRDLTDELNPRATRAHWTVQRVFWAMLALILVAALLGAFGGGPLSTATSSASMNGVTVDLEYQRWTRSRSPQSFHLTIQAPDAGAESVSVLLPPELRDRMRMEEIVPEPESSSTGPDGTLYTWSVDDWSGPVRVRLDYQSLESFLQKDELLVIVGDREQRLSFTQWIFP